jgi:hypothetical protein
MPGDDMVVRVESGSADKEHVPPKKVHEHPERERADYSYVSLPNMNDHVIFGSDLHPYMFIRVVYGYAFCLFVCMRFIATNVY